MSKINVVLVEESSLVLLGLKTILDANKEVSIIGEAVDEAELLQLLEHLQVVPHICILSLSLHPQSGYKALLKLRLLYPEISVIILSQYFHSMAVLRVLLDGASAFLLKEKAREELLTAVSSVYKNDYYVNANVTLLVMRRLQDRETAKICITHEELQFLSRCCLDEKYTNIADDLHISNRKVQRLREGLFEKLDVSCRTGLVLAALQLGVHPCT